MSGSRDSRFGFLLFLVALAALLAGCSKHESHGNTARILRLSQRNEPATLDPQRATLPDEFFIIRALSEGLVTPDPSGREPRPALAAGWETSPDGLTWTFHLRPEAKWSNGDPVTARDFVWSCRRAVTPSFAAPKAQMFFVVKNAAAFYHGKISDFDRVGFAAPDDRTLVVTLEHPVADFLALIASGPWIPVHPASVERLGNTWTRPGNFVGNGAFTLTQWQPNQHIEVRRNPAYWNASSVLLDGVRFIAFDNGNAEERAFRAGQVDVTMAVPSSRLDHWSAARPPVLHTVPLHETRYLALNVQRPPLDDVRVRRALALSLDRTALVKHVLKGGQREAFGFIPPGLGGYTQAAPVFAENADEARRLLVEAGFPGGAGFPRLEMSAWGVSTVILEAIQQMWKRELGLDIVIVQREAQVHLAALAAGDYAIGFITAIPDYDSASDLFADLMTGGAENYPQWSNAEYDRLVNAAANATDADRRLALQRNAESLLLTQMPLIPLYFNSQNFLVRPAVAGWQADALWTRTYQHIQLHEN